MTDFPDHILDSADNRGKRERTNARLSPRPQTHHEGIWWKTRLLVQLHRTRTVPESLYCLGTIPGRVGSGEVLQQCGCQEARYLQRGRSRLSRPVLPPERFPGLLPKRLPEVIPGGAVRCRFKPGGNMADRLLLGRDVFTEIAEGHDERG